MIYLLMNEVEFWLRQQACAVTIITTTTIIIPFKSRGEV